MGYETKIQMIKRKYSKQWYVNLPSAIAQAMNLRKGETVLWKIRGKESLILSKKIRKRR